jgi:hypothetical protein
MIVTQRYWLAVVGLATLVGCTDGNPRTYAIPGRLVYPDGSPVPRASVIFQTELNDRRIAARAMVNEDGSFRLTTFRPHDGIVAGEHQVAVTPLPPSDGPRVEPPVDYHYGDFETSGLLVTVTPNLNEIVVTIDRPKPAPRR